LVCRFSEAQMSHDIAWRITSNPSLHKDFARMP